MDQRIVEPLRRREDDLLEALADVRAALARAESRDEPPLAPVRPGADHTALYGAILQSATDFAIIAADLDGRIVEWNVGARNVLGWSQDDVVGRSIAMIFTPEDREIGRPETEMNRALESGYALDQRWHLRHDGSRFWADGRMMPLLGQDGVAHGYLKILRDETHRRTAMTQASAHRNVLRLITDHIDTGVVHLTLEGTVVFANPAAERILAAEAGDLHGRAIGALVPDGQETGFAAILATREPLHDVDRKMRRTDGAIVDVACGYSPVLVDGEVESVVLTLRDAAERRGLDELMRLELRRHPEPGTLAIADEEAPLTPADAAFAAAASGAVRLLRKADAAAVMMVEGDEVVCLAVAGDGLFGVGQREPPAGSLTEATVSLGRALLSEDVTTDVRVSRAPPAARAAIAVPLARRGALVGALVVTARTPGALTDRDVLVCQILAGHVATTLARTDEEQALRKLRLSEERLQLALDASESIGVWDWDVENDRCHGDARFARLFSIDPALADEGLPIARFAERLHPDDRMWVSIAAQKAMAEGGEFAMEHRVIAPDGSIRWLSSRGRSYNGADGKPKRFPGAVVDITKRKQVEASLRDAETNARLAVHAAGLGLWEYDPAADRLVLDERCKAIFGLAGDSAPTLGTLMQRVDARSRLRLSSTVKDVFASHRLTERTQEFQIVGSDSGDGAALWIEVSAQPFFETDICVRVIGVLRDISERKRLDAILRENEQRFRAVAESIPQLAWMAAPTGEIQWFNGRWFDYTGARTDEDLGTLWRTAHQPDVFDALCERMRLAFRDGIAWEDTVLLRGRDGSFRWFLSRAMPMREADGPILRWFGTHTDINDQVRAREAQARFGEDLERQVAARTEELSRINARLLAEMADRQRAEEALRQSQKMEAVGQLTGGIAHDFNNLLTGITGSLDLMRKRIDQGRMADVERYINAASTSANRAAALTHRLLAFARRQPLDAKPVDVNALVASMEDMVHRSLGEMVEMQLDLAANLWTTLCDPHQLENALLNLVINARDAMPDGGRLTIATSNAMVSAEDIRGEPDRRPGEFVALKVSDTGTGIPPDVLARIFEPFFTTKPMGQGTGLGLSMIYGFARQSEGHVAARSVVGEGTMFILHLPRFRGVGEAQVVAVRPTSDTLADGETVLVVEDDAVVRALVLDLLKDLGYQTLEAHDGIAGLGVLQGGHRVDLLVTDVGLPGLNGRQLAEMARASRPALKVLFITGYAEDAAFGNGVPDAATRMITKPFAVDDLAATMRAMLSR